ncbi:Flp pilus assembly complex ATPase component TadA [bacterium]|nr:Flp pilus assembly complex ATPase component TadA [bacterium]
MKYAVRQRPDVILFGEIRDPDSVRYAMSLAETGHLVLTTVHSRSAEQAINRIVSMFPTDEQPQIQNHLAENMIAIIIQKLVKKAKEHGVVAVHEILLNNTPVANTIRDNKLNQIDNVIFTNRKY